MKTGNAALLIAAGILLLWIVISQRTKNLSASWQALMGQSTSSGGGDSSGITSALQNFTQGLSGNVYGQPVTNTGEGSGGYIFGDQNTPSTSSIGGAPVVNTGEGSGGYVFGDTTAAASSAAGGYGGLGIPSVATNPGPGSFTNVVGDAMPSLTQFAHNAVANSLPANLFGPQWNLAITKQGTY